MDLLFLDVGCFSCSSSESDEKTFLHTIEYRFSRTGKSMRRPELPINQEMQQITYFSRAARIFTISSGSIPLLSFDSWASSGSFVSSMLSSFCLGRGVNFWAHCLRRSFLSRTTLQQSSHFMTYNGTTISCSCFAIKGYNPRAKTTKSNMTNFPRISQMNKSLQVAYISVWDFNNGSSLML